MFNINPACTPATRHGQMWWRGPAPPVRPAWRRTNSTTKYPRGTCCMISWANAVSLTRTSSELHARLD